MTGVGLRSYKGEVSTAKTEYPLGALVRGRLEALCMRPVDAARRLGVSRQVFHGWHTGFSRPRSVEDLEGLRRLLAVDYETFYEEAVKPKGALSA